MNVKPLAGSGVEAMHPELPRGAGDEAQASRVDVRFDARQRIARAAVVCPGARQR
ncbi:MAG: hypothetical protein AW07_04172 [Candidatus Accumulibacter sp. SK-11]|nr:MAG: hypothetical protein AW07_04172 [Candidatus Accumulibacter sp. SK-11]